MKVFFITTILILLAFFSSNTISSEGAGDISNSTFINPSINFGYTFNKGWFHGYQFSLNHVLDRSGNVIGVSNGFRFYSNQKNYYVDFQQSTGGFVGYGIGVNYIYNKYSSKLSYYRVKGWAGFLGLATVDLMIPKNSDNKLKFSVGAVGTLPLPIE